MKIKIGDKVEVIDETISGVVIEIKNQEITIETEEGFPLVYPINKVVKNEGFSFDYADLEKAIQEKKKGIQKSQKVFSKKKNTEKPMEVDLHIESLTSSTKNMSDFEMLNLQINTARSRLEFAIEKNIKRVVFIHGIGKGVLRAELETLFRRYEQVEFYDAEFKKYGRGATEVYIYQNY